jgi:heterodisulfide reductase subunit B2
MPEYEASARAVLRALDVELEMIQGAICCGAPIVESFTSDWVYLSIYNLARAAQMGHDTVVTLCGSCTNALTRANLALADNTIRHEAQRRFEPLGLPLPGDIKVTHLVKLLSEHQAALRRHIVRPLQLQIALTNPCQVFRPSAVMQFDDPMNPLITRQLVTLTGASIFDYAGENECCGATLHLADGRLSLAAGRRKLDATAAADALVHACGNCELLLRHFQRAITKGSGSKPQETLFLPQLLGLAMGLPEHELGLRENRWH